MNEDAIVQQALNRLKDHTGIDGIWTKLDQEIDGAIDFHFQSEDFHFMVEVKRELREYQLPALVNLFHKYPNFLVVAERIFPNLKEKLRDHKIGYLDGAGNIFVNTGGQLIWLDGQKNIEPEKPITNRAFTKTGLRTVFYLLAHENAIRMPYRTIAKHTGVALGNINNIIQGLRDAGFILQMSDKEMRLQNKTELLNRWIAGYRETLKPAVLQGRYRFFHLDDFKNWKALDVRPDTTVWGGEPAAELITNWLNPQVLTVYTAEKKGALLPKWKLIPDAAGNVLIYDKFWETDKVNADPVAPYLLVYADLKIKDDPRCLETAEMIYDKYLKNEFKQY
ncbi:type IV toxin-antitoxin system AbiEi family antitoxin [Mucilaginibacter sp. PAMB04274]|uniref:type IV toxin-antitoxin system AbiEi family antitoxin n=1 Tax=Mucilaginibacter sp. PAMB04274 TaxID=3138568 RepID=UPI0031F6F7EB